MEGQKRIRTSSESSGAAAKSEFTINDLDDDSLGIIFNKLPYCDRIGIETVCERWRDVSEANWRSYIKNLTIGEKNKKILEKILERRGHYVEEIFISDVRLHKNFKVGTIKRIFKHCPKLKRLTTELITLNAEELFACRNLEALSFSYAFGNVDEVRELFGRNKRLRQLKISYTTYQANIFDHLHPGQLEVLHLTACPNFRLTDGVADKLAESLVELKYNLVVYLLYNLQPLSKLKNLRSLFLYIALVQLETVQFLVDIGKNCQKLEHIYLYIHIEDAYTSNFIPPLFNLPCLKRLVLILNKYEIPYEELVRLFRKAVNLKFFVLSSCARCTYEEDNVKLCHEHRQSPVENLDSVASKSNKGVIITANTAVIMTRERRSRESHTEVLGKGATSCLCNLITTN